MHNHLYNKYHALANKFHFSARFADLIIDKLGIDHSPGICSMRVTEYYFLITYIENENLIFDIEGLHDDQPKTSFFLPFQSPPQRLVGNLEIKISVHTNLEVDVKPKIVSMANPNYINVISDYIKYATELIINQK